MLIFNRSKVSAECSILAIVELYQIYNQSECTTYFTGVKIIPNNIERETNSVHRQQTIINIEHTNFKKGTLLQSQAKQR